MTSNCGHCHDNICCDWNGCAYQNIEECLVWFNDNVLAKTEIDMYHPGMKEVLKQMLQREADKAGVVIDLLFKNRRFVLIVKKDEQW